MNDCNKDQTHALLCKMDEKIKELQELHLQLGKTGHMAPDLLDAVTNGLVQLPKVTNSLCYKKDYHGHHIVGAFAFSGDWGNGVIFKCKREGLKCDGGHVEKETVWFTTAEALFDFGHTVTHRRLGLASTEFTIPTKIDDRMLYAITPIEHGGKINPWCIMSISGRQKYTPISPDWNPFELTSETIGLILSDEDMGFSKEPRSDDGKERYYYEGKEAIRGYIKFLASGSRHIEWVTDVVVSYDEKRKLHKEEISLPSGDRIVATRTEPDAKGHSIFNAYWIRTPKS